MFVSRSRATRCVALICGLAVALTAVQTDVAVAEPGDCRNKDTGCTVWIFSHDPTENSNYDGYRFEKSDPDLKNNYYVTEYCGILVPCLEELVVADQWGWYRLNSMSYRYMCRYATADYKDPIGWITKRLIWVTAGTATGKSLRYRTSKQKC